MIKRVRFWSMCVWMVLGLLFMIQAMAANDFSKHAGDVAIAKMAQHTGSGDFLFTQHGTSAQLIPDNQRDDHYQLIISATDHFVGYFTERPKREAGMLSLNDFISLWKQGSDNFSKVPPNAAISAVDLTTGQTHQYVGELTQPRLSQDGKTLSYQVRLLKGVAEQPTKTVNLGYTMLFIDAFGVSWHGNHHFGG